MTTVSAVGLEQRSENPLHGRSRRAVFKLQFPRRLEQKSGLPAVLRCFLQPRRSTVEHLHSPLTETGFSAKECPAPPTPFHVYPVSPTTCSHRPQVDRADHPGRWNLEGCVALTGCTADGRQGWPEVQATPAAIIDHVRNACFLCVGPDPSHYGWSGPFRVSQGLFRAGRTTRQRGVPCGAEEGDIATRPRPSTSGLSYRFRKIP